MFPSGIIKEKQETLNRYAIFTCNLFSDSVNESGG